MRRTNRGDDFLVPGPLGDAVPTQLLARWFAPRPRNRKRPLLADSIPPPRIPTLQGVVHPCCAIARSKHLRDLAGKVFPGHSTTSSSDDLAPASAELQVFSR